MRAQFGGFLSASIRRVGMSICHDARKGPTSSTVTKACGSMRSKMVGTARVWDAASGQPLLILSGYAATVQWVEFSPDGKRLATASNDGTADVWDAMTGQQLLHFTDHTGQVMAARFSSDGTRLITGSTDRTMRIHALPIEDLVAPHAVAHHRRVRQYLHVETCPVAP